jgi:hypothetical protein
MTRTAQVWFVTAGLFYALLWDVGSHYPGFAIVAILNLIAWLDTLVEDSAIVAGVTWLWRRGA